MSDSQVNRLRDYQIDRITRIVLMCKNKSGEDCAITYDVNSDASATATLSTNGRFTPELTVTAPVSTMTMNMFEREIDSSSEELDNFLEQFIKE